MSVEQEASIDTSSYPTPPVCLNSNAMLILALANGVIAVVLNSGAINKYYMNKKILKYEI